MVASGTNYVAQLPAQPSGSIVAYYIGLEDNYGMEAGVTPFKASFSLNKVESFFSKIFFSDFIF